MLSSAAWPYPHLNLHPPRKKNKKYSKCFSWRMFSSSIISNEKKTSKGDHFFSRYGGSKTQKEIPNV
jgi:hypothetical protein